MEASHGKAILLGSIGIYCSYREEDGSITVAGVKQGAAAAFSGQVAVGDILLSINDQTLTSLQEADRLSQGPPETLCRLHLQRFGEARQPTTLILMRQPAPPGSGGMFEVANLAQESAALGARLVSDPGGRGMLVCGIHEGASAYWSDLKLGDVITDVDGTLVVHASPEDMVRLTSGPTGSRMLLRVIRARPVEDTGGDASFTGMDVGDREMVVTVRVVRCVRAEGDALAEALGYRRRLLRLLHTHINHALHPSSPPPQGSPPRQLSQASHSASHSPREPREMSPPPRTAQAPPHTLSQSATTTPTHTVSSPERDLHLHSNNVLKPPLAANGRSHSPSPSPPRHHIAPNPRRRDADQQQLSLSSSIPPSAAPSSTFSTSTVARKLTDISSGASNTDRTGPPRPALGTQKDESGMASPSLQQHLRALTMRSSTGSGGEWQHQGWEVDEVGVTLTVERGAASAGRFVRDVLATCAWCVGADDERFEYCGLLLNQDHARTALVKFNVLRADPSNGGDARPPSALAQNLLAQLSHPHSPLHTAPATKTTSDIVVTKAMKPIPLPPLKNGDDDHGFVDAAADVAASITSPDVASTTSILFKGREENLGGVFRHEVLSVDDVVGSSSYASGVADGGLISSGLGSGGLTSSGEGSGGLTSYSSGLGGGGLTSSVSVLVSKLPTLDNSLGTSDVYDEEDRQLGWYHAKENILDMQRTIKSLINKSPTSAPPHEQQAPTRPTTHWDANNNRASSITSSPSIAPSRHGSSMLAALAEGWDLDGGLYTDRTLGSMDEMEVWEDNSVGVRVRMEADPARVVMDEVRFARDLLATCAYCVDAAEERFEYCGIEDTQSTGVIACVNILGDATGADHRSPPALARQLQAKVAEQSTDTGAGHPPVQVLLYPPHVHMAVPMERGGRGGEDASSRGRSYRALPSWQTSSHSPPQRQAHSLHSRSPSPRIGLHPQLPNHHLHQQQQQQGRHAASSAHRAYPPRPASASPMMNRRAASSTPRGTRTEARRSSRRWYSSDDDDDDDDRDDDEVSNAPSRAYSVPMWSSHSTPKHEGVGKLGVSRGGSSDNTGMGYGGKASSKVHSMWALTSMAAAYRPKSSKGSPERERTLATILSPTATAASSRRSTGKNAREEKERWWTKAWLGGVSPSRKELSVDGSKQRDVHESAHGRHTSPAAGEAAGQELRDSSVRQAPASIQRRRRMLSLSDSDSD